MIIGIGTDLVEIERIRGMIERHGDHFLNRCFTIGELDYSRRHRDASVRIAGRWAAKEAVVKALGTGFVQGITFHDVEVVSLHSGQPTVVLTGEARRIADQLGITEVKLTVSHAQDYATATAIAVRDERLVQ